jgi:heme oxygenase (mycobilin-producing)
VNQDNRQADDSPVTLINVFEVPAEHADAFVDGWRERAALMSTKPGFLDTRLHRALSSQSRFQLVNVSRWESREAFETATADAEFQERIGAATADPRVPISANPGLYKVVAGYGDRR